MRELFSTYGWPRDVQPLVGLAMQVRARGAEVRMCAPDEECTDLPPRAAELVAVQFDTVAAAAERRDAPVATGVMPTGGWR